jgi:hypothetical protein
MWNQQSRKGTDKTYANASAMQYFIKCIVNGKSNFKWSNHECKI